MGRKIFAVVVTLVFIYITSPLLFPIAMGGILAVLLSPWNHQLEKRKIPSALSSALLTLGTTVLLILPGTMLIFFAGKTGLQELSAWRVAPTTGKNLLDTFLDSPRLHHLLIWASSYAPVQTTEITRTLYDLAATIGSKLAEFFAGMLTQIPGMVLAIVLVILSMYFCLVDGKKLIYFSRKNSFFTPQQTDQLIKTVGDICRSVILAVIVSGGLQALFEMIACVATGTPNIALIGLLVFISSFIPLVGSLPVTIFVGIQQWAQGHQAVGIILLIVGVLLYGMDNAVRPLFLRGSANLHPFLAFVAAIGGLQTLGFMGIFFGPICASLFLVTIQILTHSNEPEKN